MRQSADLNWVTWPSAAHCRPLESAPYIVRSFRAHGTSSLSRNGAGGDGILPRDSLPGTTMNAQPPKDLDGDPDDGHSSSRERSPLFSTTTKLFRPHVRMFVFLFPGLSAMCQTHSGTIADHQISVILLLLLHQFRDYDLGASSCHPIYTHILRSLGEADAVLFLCTTITLKRSYYPESI